MSSEGTGESDRKAKRSRASADQRVVDAAAASDLLPGSSSLPTSGATPHRAGLSDLLMSRAASSSLGMSHSNQYGGRIPFHAPMSVPDLALLNASIARTILLREQEVANQQLRQHLSMLSRATAASRDSQEMTNSGHLQLSTLSRATAPSDESLALQILRAQRQQQLQQQQAYGSMLLPQSLQRQSLLLSQLQAMSSPQVPPSALLSSGPPLQPSTMALPPPRSATIHPGRAGMNLGAAVVHPAHDSLTSALASIAHDEARRKSDRNLPSNHGGGGGPALHPNGCLYHPRAFPVAVESDKDCTSKYQAFLRQQLMYFETVPLDTQASAKGRNKPIKVGQVGILCRHCRNLPPPKRPRGSVYYPQKLVGVYQSAQNMAKNHFAGSGCANAPSEVNQELHRLRAEQTSFYGGGQPYWAKSAAMAGIVETEDGLEFVSSARSRAVGSSSGSPKGRS